MKTTLRSKTLTASLSQPPDALFAWLATPEPWSKKPEARIIRNDHSRLLDVVLSVSDKDLTVAIRVLTNGEGCEAVFTLVQPRGVSDSLFNEHVRWADSVLRAARKAPAAMAVDASTPLPLNNSTSPTPPTSPTLSSSTLPTENIPASGKKLFIGNLPFDWNEDMLGALFTDVAETTRVEIARFRGRGSRSRGFGFVEMISEEAAQTAIGKLHETMAGTRKIVVRLARSQESRPVEPPTESAAPAPVATPATSSEPEEDPNDSIGNRISDPDPNRTHRSSTQRPHKPRHRSPQGPSRHARAPQGRTRGPRTDRPYKELDIVNNSGYEYFPRRTREK